MNLKTIETEITTVEQLIEKLQKANPKAVVCKQFMFEYVPIDVIFEVINGEYVDSLENKHKSDLLIIK